MVFRSCFVSTEAHFAGNSKIPEKSAFYYVILKTIIVTQPEKSYNPFIAGLNAPRQEPSVLNKNQRPQ